MDRRAALVSTLVAVGVLGVMLLIGWGATAGPGTVVHTDHTANTQLPSVRPLPSPSSAPIGGGLQPGAPPAHHRPVFLMVVIAIATLGACALVVTMLGLIATKVMGALARRRRIGDLADGRSVGDAALLSTATTTLGDAIAAQLDEFGAGTPRDAIAACWRRLETAAGHLGVAPRRSDTPTDFVVRLLSQLGADATAAEALAALYREARFSTHAMTEDDRARARTLLEHLLTSLQTRA